MGREVDSVPRYCGEAILSGDIPVKDRLSSPELQAVSIRGN